MTFPKGKSQQTVVSSDRVESLSSMEQYIFGEKTSVDAKELEFSLGGVNLRNEKQEFDESVIVVIIITTVAILAALFYLKGYKK